MLLPQVIVAEHHIGFGHLSPLENVCGFTPARFSIVSAMNAAGKKKAPQITVRAGWLKGNDNLVGIVRQPQNTYQITTYCRARRDNYDVNCQQITADVSVSATDTVISAR